MIASRTLWRRRRRIPLLLVVAQSAWLSQAALADCLGDCNRDSFVDAGEIVLGANIALGVSDVRSCLAFDPERDSIVTIDTLTRAIGSVRHGCPLEASPSPTATPTAPASASPTGTSTAPASASPTTTATAAQFRETPELSFQNATAHSGLSYVQFAVESTASAEPTETPVGDVGFGTPIPFPTAAPSPPVGGHGSDDDNDLTSGGAAAADFDGDGLVDLYATRLHAAGILYRNRGDGSFEDVTARAGLDSFDIRSNGVAWGDIDNDGDRDLYVTSIGPNVTRHHLFLNHHGDTGSSLFTEEARERGLALEGPGPHNGYSAAFGDYDNDGWLDVYVTDWRPEFRAIGSAEPPPVSYSRLLHNLGSASPGYFEDVTEAAGVLLDHLPTNDPQRVGAVPLSPRFTDLDNDGWPDLAIAGDFGQSRLFWNNHDGTFSDGTALANVGTDENGMGSAVGDYDGDGLLDWFVTSIHDESCIYGCGWGSTGNRLYRNQGGRRFSDYTDVAGVRAGGWGWGTSFFDGDNDGDLDLVMTNGVDFVGPYADDPMRLWRNDGGGVMTEVAAAAGMDDHESGKGLLTFDYDSDGDLDVFVVNSGKQPALYRNLSGNRNNWLRARVVGAISNRDAIGARLRLTPTEGGPAQVREVDGGSNYLAQNELVVHFGLGQLTGAVFELEVTWPVSGRKQIFKEIPRNQLLTIVEPETD